MNTNSGCRPHNKTVVVKSRTMIVIITEKTPPENAVSLSVGVPPIDMTALICFH